jgi:NAD(P)-dependent dehydrogenase (short-subunit alcohol dehydrogenase family)
MADHGSNRERANSAGDVVLVLNAGSDAGFQIARDLLDSGCRVAVTGRQATALARIVHGYGWGQVLAVAADTSDPVQVQRLMNRVESRFGRIDSIVHAVEAGTGPTQARVLRMVPSNTTATRPLDIAS